MPTGPHKWSTPIFESGAITLVIGYGILTLLMGLTGTASFIAHFAHLGGMVAGLVLIRGWPQYYPTSWRPGGR